MKLRFCPFENDTVADIRLRKMSLQRLLSHTINLIISYFRVNDDYTKCVIRQPCSMDFSKYLFITEYSIYLFPRNIRVRLNATALLFH